MAQRKYLRPALRFTLLLACCTAGASFAPIQAQDTDTVKAPEWKHGMDVMARKFDEEQFDDKKTKRYGIEVFTDPNTGKLIYLAETGSMAALSGSAAGGDKASEPKFSHGLVLRVRKATEEDFGPKTKKYGVEVYRDENAGNLLYITETGNIAVVPIDGSTKPTTVKPPVWRHGLKLPVRAVGEKDVTDKTRLMGLEVFVDANNDNAIYISETGHIAVVPKAAGLPTRPVKVKNPVRKHAMELKVRNAGDKDFNDKTPKISLEVYEDPNANKLVFITTTGAISVLSGTADTSKSKDPEWKHGLDMKARKAAETDFDKATKFGVEAFTDAVTNSLIYINQLGEVAAVPLK